MVVLNYNGRQHLFECFSSLKTQTYRNFDVYLLDNCSSDDSLAYTKANFAWVKIIALPKNLGFAKGYNEAIKCVGAELVAILNNDTKVEVDWLRPLVASIMVDQKRVAVGSKIFFYTRPGVVNHAGAKITLLGGGFDIGFNELDNRRFNVAKPVGAVCGCSMLVRRKLFLALGGFDEYLSSYFEDVDFCWRAWQCGFTVFYEPASVVYHKRGGSWSQKRWLSTYLIERNRLFTMIKFFDGSRLLQSCLLSVPYTASKIASFSAKKNVVGIMAILEANLWVLFNFRGLYRRKPAFPTQTGDSKAEIFAGFSETFYNSLKHV